MSDLVATLPAPPHTLVWWKRAWVVPTVLFLCTFSLYALTAARSYSHIDAHAATVESWRIASAGNPWLDDVMTPSFEENKFIGEAPNGHIVGMRMAGPIILGIPFYAVLDHNAAKGAFSLVPGSIAAPACTAAAVLLMFLALRRKVPDVVALVGAVAFAVATPTWSVSANMLWTHPVTQVGIAGAAYAVSRSRWWLAGLFLGVGMLGRPHVAVIAAILGLGLAWSRRTWKPALGMAVPTVAALGALLLWNRWFFGVYSIGGAYGGRVSAAVNGFEGDSMSGTTGGAHAQLLNYLGFLVAPDRGFLVWSPVLLLLVPAVVRSWRHAPDWTRWLVVGGVAYSFFQLRLDNFIGGDGFYGYRLALELATCLVPVCVLAARDATEPVRRLLAPIVGLQAGAIALGAITEGFYVTTDDVWRDNSLWLALRHYPLIVGAWLLLWVLGAMLVARRVRAARTVAPVAPVASSLEG